MSQLIDIHCHLAEYENKLELSNLDREQEIIHVSTALNRKEILLHEKLGLKYWFAGLHPRDIAMSQEELRKYCDLFPYDKVVGMGEIGLDRNYPDLVKQLALLKIQIERAGEYDLPTLYHLVGQEYEFIKLQKEVKLRNMKIIHGFNSSYEVFQELDKLGFYFSLSMRILNNPKKEKVIRAILASKRYFLESDAPDAGDLTSVKIVASTLQRDYNISIEELREIQVSNFSNLLKGNFESLSKK